MVFTSFVLSDIHLEHQTGRPTQYLPPQNHDVQNLIIAGDLGNPFTNSVIQYVEEAKRRFKRVIFVRGNHDVYNSHSLYEVDKQIRSFGIDFLQNETIIIDDVEFIGTTLWSNVPPQYYKIVNQKFGYGWEITQFLHRQDRDFLEDALKSPPKATARVVVTHYPVSLEFMTDSWKNSPRSKNQAEGTFHRYYNTTMDHLFDKADVFICGHSHTFINKYRERQDGKKTLLLQNPKGYLDEQTGFDSKRYIEIDPEKDPKVVMKNLKDLSWR